MALGYAQYTIEQYAESTTEDYAIFLIDAISTIVAIVKAFEFYRQTQGVSVLSQTAKLNALNQTQETKLAPRATVAADIQSRNAIEIEGI